MNGDEFGAIRSVIQRGSGVSIPETRQYIVESRLSARVRELGMESFGEYARYLSMSPERTRELETTMRLITLAETSFYRYPSQCASFEQRILPGLIERRRAIKRLRVWTPGCATGQESYTVAHLIRRILGVRMMDWRIEVLGTDLCRQSIDAARAGRYPATELRGLDPWLIRGMFAPCEGGAMVDSELAQMTAFEVHDLRQRAAARLMGVWDAIVCRNVLGLMDADTARGCLSTLAEVLADDGALLTGHHDDGVLTGTAFEPVSDARERIYRKHT